MAYNSNDIPKPEQEPIAIVDSTISGNIDWQCVVFPKDGTKLYTTPPQRKPLTDEQRHAIARQADENDWHDYDIIDAVEAAHGIKEKNT